MVQHLVDPEQPGRCIHASGGHLLRWHGRRARRVEAVVEHGPRHPREPGLKNHQNQNNQNQNEATKQARQIVVVARCCCRGDVGVGGVLLMFTRRVGRVAAARVWERGEKL